MASIDTKYRFQAVVETRSGGYVVDARNLDAGLVPKRNVSVSRQSLRATGRGIGYTEAPLAYPLEPLADGTTALGHRWRSAHVNSPSAAFRPPKKGTYASAPSLDIALSERRTARTACLSRSSVLRRSELMKSRRGR